VSARIAIVNGRIVDGTGAPSFSGTVLVEGERLTVLRAGAGHPTALDGAEVIDARGLVVAPGIVDLHTHSDVSNLSEPGAISAIEQGVTTQVVGLCGFSAGPVRPETLATMIQEEPVFGFPDVPWDWTSIGGYRESVDRSGVATNTVTLLGHNTLRRYVMGGAERAPTPDELRRMQDEMRRAFDEGARGFSTGLTYAPGLFATTDELVELTRVAAEHDRPYHTHMRVDELPISKPLAEALETAERSGVELEISHLYPTPIDPADEAERLIDMIEASRARGVRATWDVTVFPRGGGAWAQYLPAWVRAGGAAATTERLRDASLRPRIRAGIEASGWLEWSAGGFDDELIVKVSRPETRWMAGRSIGEIARERGADPLDTALDLLIEDPQFWTGSISKRQPDLDRMIAHKLGIPVTDGMAAHPVKHRALGIMPKTFGSFPQILGRYVREAGVMSLEAAIAKMTSVAAGRIDLHDRGVLADGYAADLFIFDPATIANRATDVEEPTARPAGIERVMVNGRWAVIGGAATGERPGTFL
jgi:N-acyl-D-aspartate/D-glutamate deacylase